MISELRYIDLQRSSSSSSSTAILFAFACIILQSCSRALRLNKALLLIAVVVQPCLTTEYFMRPGLQRGKQ